MHGQYGQLPHLLTQHATGSLAYTRQRIAENTNGYALLV